MMAPPYPMTGNRYSSIRNNNLKGMDNIGIYQRNHIVMLDSRKSLCVVPYKNSNIFWYLVGPPKPLGPIAAAMAATATVTPMSTAKYWKVYKHRIFLLFYCVFWSQWCFFLKHGMLSKNCNQKLFQNAIETHNIFYEYFKTLKKSVCLCACVSPYESMKKGFCHLIPGKLVLVSTKLFFKNKQNYQWQSCVKVNRLH